MQHWADANINGPAATEPTIPPEIAGGGDIPESAILTELSCATKALHKHAKKACKQAHQLAAHARKHSLNHPGLDSLLTEYALDTREGVVLMCLAEALLRIPDSGTAQELLHDQFADADWAAHLAHSHSAWINASTWGLVLTGSVLHLHEREPAAVLKQLIGRLGDSVVLAAAEKAIGVIANRFVAGQTIEEALKHGREESRSGYCHSYDMLGEAARTAQQSTDHFEAYLHALSCIGRSGEDAELSVKLSALSPRYEFSQRERVIDEVSDRLTVLAELARTLNLQLTVDAEEARHLELSLEIFKKVYLDHGLRGWEGLGLAVQSYQTRAGAVVEWLSKLHATRGRRICLRLVKGAYWDSEIKYAQQQGLAHYPVFTRKSATDISYLSLARHLLMNDTVFLPQFATHNAMTISAILQLNKPATKTLEFQRLHGMGRALYDPLLKAHSNIRCRVYAPAGRHRELLPYLVRRLLENGANSSFVHALGNPDEPLESLLADPLKTFEQESADCRDELPPPPDLYGPGRRNAPGIILASGLWHSQWQEIVQGYQQHQWESAAIVSGESLKCSDVTMLRSPANQRLFFGNLHKASAKDCRNALSIACAAAEKWAQSPQAQRADRVERIADALWANRDELLALLVFEAGKTMPAAIGEIREAMDFCFYYAQQSRLQFSAPYKLPGPTGEENLLSMRGRGVFACISPWNFPLAVFTGQIAAALVTGNCVLAKPASNTPCIGYRVVQLMHAAGIPADVLHYLPADSEDFSTQILADPQIAGVAFTGSTRSAWTINRTLAAREAPIVPLIAETGGQNAMIVDSTALPEQVADEVLRSAFDSAGQRCSALRVLFVQEEIADAVIDVVAGALAELCVGHPADPGTDCGPLISHAAKVSIEKHLEHLSSCANRLAIAPQFCNAEDGHYLQPQVWEISDLGLLTEEVFGPVLHVIRYQSGELDQVIRQINATGFGLTLGICTRMHSRWKHLSTQIRAGNVYVNRDMIGATVGVQPFGGNGLSGTGPKAGGPHYLQRFSREHTCSVNTTAIGGNTELLSQRSRTGGWSKLS